MWGARDKARDKNVSGAISSMWVISLQVYTAAIFQTLSLNVLTWRVKDIQLNPVLSNTLSFGFTLLWPYTKWFKYDQDDLCVNKSQFVPVIFEPPCSLLSSCTLLCLLQSVQDRLWAQPFPFSVGTGVLFQGQSSQGVKFKGQFHMEPRFKNKVIYTSTSPIRLHGLYLCSWNYLGGHGGYHDGDGNVVRNVSTRNGPHAWYSTKRRDSSSSIHLFVLLRIMLSLRFCQ